MSLGNCILNPQWNTTIYALGWLTSEALTIPNGHLAVEQQELALMVAGETKWDSHLGRQWEFPTELSVLPHNPAVVLLLIYPDLLKTYIYAKATLIFYSNFIHNCQDLKATKMSFKKSMDKLWYIQTTGYDLAKKQKWAMKNHRGALNAHC